MSAFKDHRPCAIYTAPGKRLLGFMHMTKHSLHSGGMDWEVGIPPWKQGVAQEVRETPQPEAGRQVSQPFFSKGSGLPPELKGGDRGCLGQVIFPTLFSVSAENSSHCRGRVKGE